MNQQDIIQMAREAGAMPYTNRHYPDRPAHAFGIEQLERFAALVADAAKAEEREACARFLESTNLAGLPEDTALHYARLLKGFAEGIRARGETKRLLNNLQRPQE